MRAKNFWGVSESIKERRWVCKTAVTGVKRPVKELEVVKRSRFIAGKMTERTYEKRALLCKK